MSKKTNTKSVITIISLIIETVYFILSLFSIVKIFSLNMIPTKYSLILIFAYVITLLLGIKVALSKKARKWVKILFDIITTCGIALFIFILNYLGIALNTMDNIMDKKYQTEGYYLLVLKDSGYKKLSDIKGKTVGTYQNNLENYNKAISDIKKEVSITTEEKEDINDAATDFLNKKVDSFLISSVFLDQVETDVDGFAGSYKKLKTFNYKIKKEETKVDADVKNESFNVLISGADYYGSMSDTSRSDVNMVATINPKTHQVLLSSIPRDYYVQLHGTKGYKDKLTHSGVYGIDMTVNTIEDLLDIDINYYARVNFISLISLVDAIDGVTVYNEEAFRATDWKYFKAGNITLNGEEALSFARERKAFAAGDVQRVKNQQKVLTAIIQKMTSSKTLISKYNNIMKTMGKSFSTNMDQDKIYDLINLQLSDMPSWNIESCNATGFGDSKPTYTYPGQALYVMQPDQNSINEVKEKIKEVYSTK